MTDKQYFHFSLAPVQGFIAQARRTRDFWTGSFILSWLSAVAMNAVVKQGGNIIFPDVNEAFLTDLLESDESGKPEHGGVPNRFKAEVSKDFKPEIVVASVQMAWQALADKVFEGDFMTASPLKDWQSSVTKKIWDEQVKTFWDMTWVLTEDDKNSAALDVRKNWRSYLPPEQAGVKCMVMEGWQELSGVDKPSQEVKNFWKEIRDKGKNGMKTDLRLHNENKIEILCAIAFIKRRFPHYFHLINTSMPNGWTLKGWGVNPGRPSVAYMAAVHWLKIVLEQTTQDEPTKLKFEKFYEQAKDLMGSCNKWDSEIQCIENIAVKPEWKRLDGYTFFDFTLENTALYENKKQAEQAKKALGELKELQKMITQTLPNFKPATPFFAVLMMDGDSLGKQMSDTDKQGTITQGLKSFTDSVPNLVKNHNGFLIYAGGDDVLALLPLEGALSCALAIRQKYECVFADLNLQVSEEKQVFTSISAAVVFAHIKMPLTKVLKTVHKLLDDVAKDKYGRDSLAVSVWKAGGEVLQWARPWDKAIENKQLVIERLKEQFASDDESGQLSNRFLYKIRERFELLNPPIDKKDKSKRLPLVLSDAQAIDLMAAEYFSSGLCDKLKTDEKKVTHAEKMNHAKTIVTPLLEQCRPIYRKLDENNQVSFGSGVDVLVDAALLVRFLAQKGVNL